MNLFDKINGLDSTTIQNVTPKKKAKKAPKKVVTKVVEELITDIPFEPVQEQAAPQIKIIEESKTEAPKDIFTETILIEKLCKAKVKGNVVKIVAKPHLFNVIREKFAIFGGEYVRKTGFVFPYSPIFLLAILSSKQSVLQLIEDNKIDGKFKSNCPPFIKEIAKNIVQDSAPKAPKAPQIEVEKEEIYYPHLDNTPIEKDTIKGAGITKEESEAIANSFEFSTADKNEAWGFFKTELIEHYGKISRKQKVDFDLEFIHSGTFWDDDFTAFEVSQYINRIKKYDSWDAYLNSEEVELERC